MWEIDIEAKNVVQAAKIARDMQLSTKSTATIFKARKNLKQNPRTNSVEFDIGPMKPVKEPMDAKFAIFNCHINDAKDRAKDAFIAFHGKKAWNTYIQPKIDDGIMSIFNEVPNEYTKFFVYTVWTMVNKF